MEFVLNVQENKLEVYYQECIQPDPCPGCGNCLLCDSKCTC